jgi:sterol desaturase/sphingolipid hydroxylase (fatty acid hydroxylase superfamily)
MASNPGLHTRLTPAECAIKAQSAIVTEAEVVGVSSDTLVLMRKLKGNTFQTVLRAKLTPLPDGTSVLLTAGMDRVVFVFACIFMGAFAAIAVAFLVAFLGVFQSFQFSAQDRKDWLFLSTPLLALVAGVGLIRLGRYVSRHEGPFLKRLLHDALELKAAAK